MEYKKARMGNFIVGAVGVGFEAFAYRKSYFVERIDEVYLGVISFLVLEGIIALMIFGNKERSLYERAWRALCGSGSVSVGVMLMISAVHIEGNTCKFMPDFVFDGGYKCQYLELKLIAGVLAIGNGVLYFCARVQDSPQSPGPALVYSAQAFPRSTTTDGRGEVPAGFNFPQVHLSTQAQDKKYYPSPAQEPPQYYSIYQNQNQYTGVHQAGSYQYQVKEAPLVWNYTENNQNQRY